MTIGKLRFIQSVFETPDFQNPDSLVRRFLPIREQCVCLLRGSLRLDKLRSYPFYYYLIARTKHYDELFADAIHNGVQFILNIGCGSDTRAHRFAPALKQKGITVLECDLSEVICAKQTIARKHWPDDPIEYLSLDLNDNAWPYLQCWLSKHPDARMLVLMEGVTPYLNAEAVGQFLSFLSESLQTGSRIAYDFKIEGIDDEHGCSRRTERPFRLPETRSQVVSYHEARGYVVDSLESSADVSERLLPGLRETRTPLFTQDGLILLSVSPH
jgi:methyltransferase (TIGR00027 family)